VNAGRLTLEHVVRLVAETPAHLYRLWPKKGNLLPGADADIVLVDVNSTHVLTNKTVVSKAGWTPYDGLKVQGRSVATYVRGNLIARDGKVMARPGVGQYLLGPGAGRAFPASG
jgi:dihydroorotase-like cyclic amidohydrolase